MDAQQQHPNHRTKWFLSQVRTQNPIIKSRNTKKWEIKLSASVSTGFNGRSSDIGGKKKSVTKWKQWKHHWNILNSYICSPDGTRSGITVIYQKKATSQKAWLRSEGGAQPHCSLMLNLYFFHGAVQQKHSTSLFQGIYFQSLTRGLDS